MARLAGMVQGVVVQMTMETFSPARLGRMAPMSEETGNFT